MTVPWPWTGPHVVLAPGVVDVGVDAVTVDGDDGHHLARVLRLAAGDRLTATDGVGHVWDATVAGVRGGRVDLALVGERAVPRAVPAVTVVHGLPKGRKLDDVVQRLTELGVERIVPATTVRSEVALDEARAAKAVDRWRRIAKAAAEQSRRAWLPEVGAVTSWNAALAGARGIICWEQAVDPLGPAVDRLREHGVDAVVAAVGPEGGLTADEARAGGLPPVRLGDTVLRTETAAVVAAALVLHRLGRLG